MLTQKTGPPISFACENFNDNDKQKTKQFYLMTKKNAINQLRTCTGDQIGNKYLHSTPLLHS